MNRVMSTGFLFSPFLNWSLALCGVIRLRNVRQNKPIFLQLIREQSKYTVCFPHTIWFGIRKPYVWTKHRKTDSMILHAKSCLSQNTHSISLLLGSYDEKTYFPANLSIGFHEFDVRETLNHFRHKHLKVVTRLTQNRLVPLFGCMNNSLGLQRLLFTQKECPNCLSHYNNSVFYEGFFTGMWDFNLQVFQDLLGHKAFVLWMQVDNTTWSQFPIFSQPKNS